DPFAGEGKDKLTGFREYRQPIEWEVRRKYLAGDTELVGSILIHSDDLPDAKQPGEASQPAEPDGGSPEGIGESAEDRSPAGAEQYRELSNRSSYGAKIIV